MDGKERDLDDLVRDELGEEPSQEAKDYAHQLYEKYRMKAPAPEEDTAGSETPKGDG